MSSLVKRIDPVNCGCTDCITGYSLPLNEIPFDELKQTLALVYVGVITNATGGEVVRTVNYSVEY